MHHITPLQAIRLYCLSECGDGSCEFLLTITTEYNRTLKEVVRLWKRVS